MRNIVEIDIPYRQKFEKRAYSLRYGFRDKESAIRKAELLRELGFLVRRTQEPCKVKGKPTHWWMLWIREDEGQGGRSRA